MGLMSSVKSQNAGSLPRQDTGGASQNTNFKSYFNAMMANKGSKCKCDPNELNEGEGQGGLTDSMNIFTRNEGNDLQ